MPEGLFECPPEGLSESPSEFRGSSRRAVRDIVRGTVRPPPEGLSGEGVHPRGWEVVNPSCGDLHRRSTPTLLPLRFESVRIRSNLVCSLHSGPGRARYTENFRFLSRSPTKGTLQASPKVSVGLARIKTGMSLRMTERYLRAHLVMHHHNELNVTKQLVTGSCITEQVK